MKLEITRRSDLAVRALCVLGSGESRMKGPELAEKIDTTASFVPQVLAPLVKGGWISSTPGPTGGYFLNVELDDVSLLEVIEAVEGPSDENACALDGGVCDEADRCAIHDAWVKARNHLVAELAATPISQATPRGDCR